MSFQNDVNEITLIGKIGKKSELKEFGGGHSKCAISLSVATTETYKKRGSQEWQKRVQWHNVVAWGVQARFIEKNHEVGDAIYAKGKLKYRQYDKTQGSETFKVTIAEIEVSNFMFLNKKAESTSNQSQSAAPSSSGGQSRSSSQSQRNKEKSHDQIARENEAFPDNIEGNIIDSDKK